MLNLINCSANTIEKQIIWGNVFGDIDSVGLPGVSIQAADARKGTISKKYGKFELELTKRKHTLIFSMVGKERLLLEIDSIYNDSVNIIVYLKDNSVLKGEVTVIAEDPGARLMRLAIQKKNGLKDSINSYSYMLYTKFVASTDTSTAGRKVRNEDTTIVSILESYSKGFFKSPDKYYNEIVQKKQSVNIPPQANFVAFGTNLNAYDDYITLVGEEVETPFHFDAYDDYEYILDEEYSDTIKKIKRIIVTPKSDYAKLFRGFVYLDSELLFPTKVELYPNRAVKLPFDAELVFKQSFQLIDDKFCMPEKMHIYTTLDATFAWIYSPRLDLNIFNVAYGFEINPILDNALFRKRRVETSKSADEYDSTYWRDKRKILLSPKEAAAYEEIRIAQENPDSVLQTGLLRKLLAPIEEKLKVLNNKPFTGLEDIFRYNRVNGAYLGFGLTFDFYDFNNLKFLTGYGLSDEKVQYFGEFTRFLNNDKGFSIFGKVYDYTDRSDDKEIIPQGSITALSLLFKNDYGDYYYNRGFEVGFEAGFGQIRFISRDNFQKPRKIRIYYKNENHESAETNTDFAFLSPNAKFRINPPVVAGKMNSINFDWVYDYTKRRRLANFGFILQFEYSDKSVLASDFEFTRLSFEMRTKFKTLPLWNLQFNVKSGISFGELPPQRFFSLAAPISRFATMNSFRGLIVKEFYGDHYLMLSAEHNFGEVIPGVLRIPNVASFGLEFIAFANFGWSSFENSKYGYLSYNTKFIPSSTNLTDDKYYYEAGIGINRLLIFLRIDVGYRFTQIPRTLITISAATF